MRRIRYEVYARSALKGHQMKHLHGGPIGTHRALTHRYERVERALSQTVARNDEKQALALHLKAIEAGNAVPDLFRNHLRGGPTP